MQLHNDVTGMLANRSIRNLVVHPRGITVSILAQLNAISYYGSENNIFSRFADPPDTPANGLGWPIRRNKAAPPPPIETGL